MGKKIRTYTGVSPKKGNKMAELRFNLQKEEMRRLGYIPENFSDQAIQAIADGTYKGINKYKLKSFGSKMEMKDGHLITVRTKEGIRKRQIAQMKSYHPDKKDPLTFGQTIAMDNVNEYFGYNVFDFIKENHILDYDISTGIYYDPITGERRDF